jgi:predicted RNA-binding Zn ribbon-like protein
MKGVKVHFGDYTDPVATLAEDLVNSYSHSEHADLLDAASLADVAGRRGWRGSPPTAADVERVRALRPLLRAVFEASEEQQAVDMANAVVERSGLMLRLTRHDSGPWHFHGTPGTGTLFDWLAGLSGFALLSVIERGDGDRIRHCAGADCHAVFVDVSRNKSRRFCSPAVCGNRAHVAAFRARQYHARPDVS